MSTLYMFPNEQKPPEHSDTLAGEYALGTMDAGEAAATRLRADTDPVLLAAIGAWQARLATLAGMLPEAEPPAGLWDRLAADAGIRQVRPEPARLIVAAAPQAEADDSGPAAPELTEPEVAGTEPAAGPEAVPEIAPGIAPEPPPEPPAQPPAAMAPAPPPLKFTLPVPVDPQPPSWPPALPAAALAAAPPPAPVIQIAAAPDWPEDPAPVAAVPAIRLLDRLLLWRVAAGVLLLASIGLGVALWRSGGTPQAVAAIGVANAPAPLFLAEADASGALRVTPLAVIAVPNGRDLQLWMQPPGGREPTSLGVLSASGSTVALGGPPIEGTRLLISLEPRGGAVSGHITGQVLYGGTLANR